MSLYLPWVWTIVVSIIHHGSMIRNPGVALQHFAYQFCKVVLDSLGFVNSGQVNKNSARFSEHASEHTDRGAVAAS